MTDAGRVAGAVAVIAGSVRIPIVATLTPTGILRPKLPKLAVSVAAPPTNTRPTASATARVPAAAAPVRASPTNVGATAVVPEAGYEAVRAARVAQRDAAKGCRARK